MYKLYLIIDWNILFYTDYCGEFWRSTAYTSCRGGIRKACYQRKQVGHNIFLCINHHQKESFCVLILKIIKFYSSLSCKVSTVVHWDLHTGFLEKKCLSTSFVIYLFRQEYIDAYVDYLFNKSVADHFSAFSDGFHKVCGGKVLVSRD